ncbi:MAG: hypothetical protein Q8916_13100 [Bacteroidota bacterium]|nr:hypothetical protein [Bacteroidota bacterium]MDP4231329.1 hypothetical protein [Bacteroidota bacterium]
MKNAFQLFFGLLALSMLVSVAAAQDSGGQDSTGLSSPALRPRRDTYIIETFPSPARRGEIAKIQFYNHYPLEASLRIVDINDKIVKELQPRQMLPNGIHSYDFQTNLVATGTYHIRLVTYTSTGSENITQDSRFIVLH